MQWPAHSLQNMCTLVDKGHRGEGGFLNGHLFPRQNPRRLGYETCDYIVQDG